MIYCFDIDGTICTNTDGNYQQATPFRHVIDRINSLFNQDHTIYLYTARGSTTDIDWREITKQQLDNWGVRYHRLFMGKPTADVYVDDKCINLREWLKSDQER